VETYEEAVACRTQAPGWRGAEHTPAHTWCLGFLPGGWAHPSAHVVLGLPPCGLGTSQRTRGAWIALGEPGSCPIEDKWHLGHGSRLKENELGVRTHDQWV